MSVETLSASFAYLVWTLKASWKLCERPTFKRSVKYNCSLSFPLMICPSCAFLSPRYAFFYLFPVQDYSYRWTAAPSAPQSTLYPSGGPSSSHQFTYPTSLYTPLTQQIRQVGIQARADISGCHLSVSESFLQLQRIQRMIISYRRWASLPSMIL